MGPGPNENVHTLCLERQRMFAFPFNCWHLGVDILCFRVHFIFNSFVLICVDKDILNKINTFPSDLELVGVFWLKEIGVRLLDFPS